MIGPAIPEPIEKPNQASSTRVTRKRLGMKSAVRARAFGTTPPSPRPVANRIHISSRAVFAVDVATLQTAKNSRQAQVFVMSRRLKPPPLLIIRMGRPKSYGPFTNQRGPEARFVNIEDVHRWPLAPRKEPSGLAVDAKNDRLFAVCGNYKMVVGNADTGKVENVPTKKYARTMAIDFKTHKVRKRRYRSPHG